MLMTTQYDAERERRAIETLREHRVEGLILTVADATRTRFSTNSTATACSMC